MNLQRSNFGQGQAYRLSHLAIRLRTFTARELIALTGMVEDTVYGFLAKLTPPGYLQWEELPRSTRGRPVKRYTLTEAGVDYLLERNADIASILRGDGLRRIETEAEPAAAIAAIQQPASARAEAAAKYSAVMSDLAASAE
jgi:DNA-binding PadR family transcriptional regulator